MWSMLLIWRNSLVLKAFENYSATLTKSAKQGILPIFFSKIFLDRHDDGACCCCP